MNDQTNNEENADSSGCCLACHATSSVSQPEVNHDELRLHAVRKKLLEYGKIVIIGILGYGFSVLYDFIRTRITAFGRYESWHDPFAFMFFGTAFFTLFIGMLLLSFTAIAYIYLFLQFKLRKHNTE